MARWCVYGPVSGTDVSSGHGAQPCASGEGCGAEVVLDDLRGVGSARSGFLKRG